MNHLLPTTGFDLDFLSFKSAARLALGDRRASKIASVDILRHETQEVVRPFAIEGISKRPRRALSWWEIDQDNSGRLQSIEALYQECMLNSCCLLELIAH